jgi:hypothetical protein
MKSIYQASSLLGCSFFLLLSSCDKKPVAPIPTLEGAWKADSLHSASYSSSNVIGPISTLLAAPNTTLVFNASTLTDVGSLGLGGTSTNPITYNYTRSGNALTVTHPTVTLQYTGAINVLTDHRLQLSFVKPAGFGNSLQYVEAFYSR